MLSRSPAAQADEWSCVYPHNAAMQVHGSVIIACYILDTLQDNDSGHNTVLVFPLLRVDVDSGAAGT